MSECTVAYIIYNRHPVTQYLYGWLALAEDAPGVPLGGGDERDLWNAAVALLSGLYGGNPYRIEFRDVGYTALRSDVAISGA